MRLRRTRSFAGLECDVLLGDGEGGDAPVGGAFREALERERALLELVGERDGELVQIALRVLADAADGLERAGDGDRADAVFLQQANVAVAAVPQGRVLFARAIRQSCQL